MRAPDLLLYGALIELCSYIKNDQAMGKYVQMYEKAKTRILQEDEAVSFGGEIAMRYDG